MTLLKEMVDSKKLTEATDEATENFWTSFDDAAVKNAEEKLEQLLTSLVKVPVDLQISKSPRGRFDKVGLTVDSNNLATKMTPRMFKTLKISDFGGNITDDGYYWLPLHYEYQHIDGGSNGTSIADVFLSSDGSIFKTNTKFK